MPAFSTTPSNLTVYQLLRSMRGQVLKVLFSSMWTKLWPNDLFEKKLCILFQSYCKCWLILFNLFWLIIFLFNFVLVLASLKSLMLCKGTMWILLFKTLDTLVLSSLQIWKTEVGALHLHLAFVSYACIDFGCIRLNLQNMQYAGRYYNVSEDSSSTRNIRVTFSFTCFLFEKQKIAVLMSIAPH